MSQSDEHKRLVREMAHAIAIRYPEVHSVVDLPRRPHGTAPPLVGGYRPDVYGRDAAGELVVVGEAETAAGLERRHTRRQLRAFADHLEHRGGGIVVLAVPGGSADRAKTLLRFLAFELRIERAELRVFDGLDFWVWTPVGGEAWRLD